MFELGIVYSLCIKVWKRQNGGQFIVGFLLSPVGPPTPPFPDFEVVVALVVKRVVTGRVGLSVVIIVEPPAVKRRMLS